MCDVYDRELPESISDAKFCERPDGCFKKISVLRCGCCAVVFGSGRQVVWFECDKPDCKNPTAIEKKAAVDALYGYLIEHPGETDWFRTNPLLMNFRMLLLTKSIDDVMLEIESVVVKPEAEVQLPRTP